MLIRSEQNKRNLFFMLYFLFVVIMIPNFFLTPNPLAALHSGRAGFGYEIMSDSFFVVPAYLVLLSLIALTIYKRNVILDYKMILTMVTLFVSGLYTEALFTNTVSYVYNILTFTLLSSLAIQTYRLNEKMDFTKNLKEVAKIMTVLLFAGVLLALLFPDRYGFLPFEFSRFSRGEVTLWNVTGVLSVYPAIAILVYRKFKIRTYLVMSLLMSVVIFSTATRAHAVITLLPFLIVILFNLKFTHKLLFLLLTTPIIVFYNENILNFFTGSGNAADLSNGRLELWEYHFKNFSENVFFGTGASFMQRMNDYTGGAVSEVGFLMWFSENGLIFGIIFLFFILKAAFIAVKLLSKGSKTTDVEMFFSIILLSLLPNLLQSYGRILSLDDVIFWFSVFFLNCYRKPLLPYTVLKK